MSKRLIAWPTRSDLTNCFLEGANYIYSICRRPWSPACSAADENWYLGALFRRSFALVLFSFCVFLEFSSALVLLRGQHTPCLGQMLSLDLLIGPVCTLRFIRRRGVALVLKSPSPWITLRVKHNPIPCPRACQGFTARDNSLG